MADYKLKFKGKGKFRLVKWTREGERNVPKEAGSWVIPTPLKPNTFYIIRLNNTDLFHVHVAGKFVRLNITRTAMRQFDSE